MPHCAIIWCKNQSKNLNKQNSGITYHKFPNDPHLKDKWISATGKYNWFPQKHDKICSVHFEEKSIIKKGGSTRLSVKAVPKLKLHPIFNDIDKEDKDKEEPEQAVDDFHHEIYGRQSPQDESDESKTSNVQASSRIRKLKINVMRPEQTIKRQRLQINRLRETNKQLLEKIAKLENIISLRGGPEMPGDKEKEIQT